MGPVHLYIMVQFKVLTDQIIFIFVFACCVEGSKTKQHNNYIDSHMHLFSEKREAKHDPLFIISAALGKDFLLFFAREIQERNIQRTIDEGFVNKPWNFIFRNCQVF